MMMCLPVTVAVAAVHEQMYQRAGQQKQLGQNSKYMGAVFGE